MHRSYDDHHTCTFIILSSKANLIKYVFFKCRACWRSFTLRGKPGGGPDVNCQPALQKKWIPSDREILVGGFNTSEKY